MVVIAIRLFLLTPAAPVLALGSRLDGRSFAETPFVANSSTRGLVLHVGRIWPVARGKGLRIFSRRVKDIAPG